VGDARVLSVSFTPKTAVGTRYASFSPHERTNALLVFFQCLRSFIFVFGIERGRKIGIDPDCGLEVKSEKASCLSSETVLELLVPEIQRDINNPGRR
jgi:hypothetical protein